MIHSDKITSTALVLIFVLALDWLFTKVIYNCNLFSSCSKDTHKEFTQVFEQI